MASARAHVPNDLAQLRDRIGVRTSTEVLTQAVTHRSYAYENGDLPHNERLEFLGDAVLGLVATDELYRRHPDAPEGQLARLRAAVVNAGSLASAARGIGLGGFILLGIGERRTKGRDKPSILADTLEAVIGAVYVEEGLAAATALIHRLLDDFIDRAELLGAGLDWKTSLQELVARLELGTPTYQVSDEGPDHAKTFTAQVAVDGVVYGSGTGTSKKAAEAAAAEAAWSALGSDETVASSPD